MSEVIFPNFGDWEPTRQTLHWYSRGISAIPRAHAEAHPKWWHVSLEIVEDGLVTSKTALPDGRAIWLKMDLINHKGLLFIDDGVFHEISFLDRLSSTAFAEALLAKAAQLGLSGPYEREKFEDEDPRDYDPEEVGKFFTALVNVDRLLKQHRSTIPGEKSPVQFWPHGFDISFEWFGTRVEVYNDTAYPSQLNLGFYPGDANNKPYFYSNPWPFDGDRLLEQPLPPGATWHTEGWEGTYLPYAELAGKADSADRFAEFARVVFDITSPTLSR